MWRAKVDGFMGKAAGKRDCIYKIPLLSNAG